MGFLFPSVLFVHQGVTAIKSHVPPEGNMFIMLVNNLEKCFPCCEGCTSLQGNQRQGKNNPNGKRPLAITPDNSCAS